MALPERTPSTNRLAWPPSEAGLLIAAALGFVLIPAVCVSMLASTQFDDAVPTGGALAIGIAALAYLVRRNPTLRQRPGIAGAVFGIFALRLALGLVVARWWWWPEVLAGEGNDWDVYERLGWELARSGLALEALVGLKLDEIGTAYLVGAVYWLVGRNPLVLTIVFTLLSAGIVLALTSLVTLTAGPTAGAYAGLVASIVPAGVFLAVLPTKDIPVALCFVQVLVIALRSQVHGWRARSVALGLLLMFLIVMMRATAAAILVVSLVGVFAVGLRHRLLAAMRRRRGRSVMVFAILLALLGYAAIAWREAVLGRGTRLSPMTVSQYVHDHAGRPGARPSDAGVQFTTEESTSLALRTYWDGEPSRAYLIPLRAALLMFVPFPPLDFGTLDMAFATANTVLMLLLVPAVWAALAHAPGGLTGSLRGLAPLWIPMAVHLAALAASVPFIIGRHALLAQYLFVGLAVAGFRRDGRIVGLYLLAPVGVALLVLAYLLVKS